MPAHNALRAAYALAAVIASFITVWFLCRWAGGGTQPAIIAALVAISLASRPTRTRSAHPGLQAVALTSIAPLAAGIGWLLHAEPIGGAVVFTAAMFLTVWLRNFGGPLRSIAGFAALPLVAILIVPAPLPTARGGPAAELALVLCSGLIALAYVNAIARLASRAGFPLADQTPAPVDLREKSATSARAGLTVPTRMAMQLAVALAAAFATGFAFFPGHWGWAVLTAFIVCSGARGRGDALYKGVLRLLGAAAGTLLAALFSLAWRPGIGGPGEAVAIFAVLYVGLLLRAVNYAYWACCMTLILALLAPSNDGFSLHLLELRMLAILTGAACAVAAAWFVFPIRTRAVIRRRLAEALGAFDEVIAHAHPHADRVEKLRLFEAHLTELDRVAAPVEWQRRVLPATCGREHPAVWIERARALREHARSLAADGADAGRRARIRRAVGLSRRALANHGKADSRADSPSVRTSLDDLHTVLTANRPEH